MKTTVAVLLFVVLSAHAMAMEEGTSGSQARQGALPESPIPQPQSTLPRMLELSWSAGPPMPQGMQDNHVGVLHNWIVSVAGFCGGADDDWKPGV